MALLLIERAILESIGNKEKNLDQISDDTGIKKDIAERIVTNFLREGLVYKKELSYLVDQNKLLKFVKNKMKGEVSEMLDCFCDMHFSQMADSHMKLKKVVLNKSELQYFNSMWKNMEDYLNRIKNEASNPMVKDQTVVFWGWGQYSEMLNQYMKI